MRHIHWRQKRKLECEASTSTSRLQYIEPELLAMILTFLVDSGEDFSTASDAAVISRASALCTVGLVCRSWQAISQGFLYEHPRPQSLKALIQLHKLLRMNNGLAQKVKSLSPLIFEEWSSGMNPKHDQWPMGVHCLLPKEHRSMGLVFLSMSDYFSMFRMFREVAMECPNLLHLSLPTLLNHEMVVIPFCPRQVRSRITSLTLSPLPFRDLRSCQLGSRLLNELPPLYFPNLKRLQLIDLTDFVVNHTIADCIHTPILEEITISGVKLTSSALRKFIKPVEGTLNTLDILGVTVDHGSDRRGKSVWQPQTLRLVSENIKHLAITAMDRSDALTYSEVGIIFNCKHKLTIPSLETLRLHTRCTSSLIELDCCYPSLQVLHVKYRNTVKRSTPSNEEANFGHLIRYPLVHFVKNKDIYAPQLREITLDWSHWILPVIEKAYDSDCEYHFDYTCLPIMNKLRWMCAEHDVKLDYRVSCGTSLSFCPFLSKGFQGDSRSLKFQPLRGHSR
jgi:hypothetical protein